MFSTNIIDLTKNEEEEKIVEEEKSSISFSLLLICQTYEQCRAKKIQAHW